MDGDLRRPDLNLERHGPAPLPGASPIVKKYERSALASGRVEAGIETAATSRSRPFHWGGGGRLVAGHRRGALRSVAVASVVELLRFRAAGERRCRGGSSGNRHRHRVEIAD